VPQQGQVMNSTVAFFGKEALKGKIPAWKMFIIITGKNSKG
jgi:hypothetical protein